MGTSGKEPAQGRLIDRLLGQERVKALLAADLRAGRLPHALLITGPAGVGKSTLARAVAQALLCAHPDISGWGCGICPDCQAVEAGVHPDLHWLAARDGQRIGLDLLREWVRQVAALRPARANYSVGVLIPADMLTDAGQNMLLKSLEEPPERVKWLLVTESPAGLLPTVRSRCQQVSLTALPVALVEAWLVDQGVPQQVAASVARLSGGRPAIARELSAEESAALRRAVAEWVLQLGKVSAHRLFEEAQAWAEAQDLAKRLETLALVLRDLALVASAHGQVQQVHELLLVPELKERLVKGDLRVPESEIFIDLAKEAYQMARKVGQLGSARLGVEVLFLRVRDGWHKERSFERVPAQRR
ncbi:MAG: DNA polymerase III subunit [Limnochordales bacterium]|nr:DNA polymerase III subunit [Limnochordales bacterium]